MSTLTSLVKSGKRKIIKTRTGFRTATKTALGRPDRRASQDPMRPQDEMLNASSLTTLGRPDRNVSPDPVGPQDDPTIST